MSLALDGPRRLRHAALHSAGHAVDKAVVGAVGAGVLSPLKGYHFDDSPYVEYGGVLPESLTKDAFIEKVSPHGCYIAPPKTGWLFGESGLMVLQLGDCSNDSGKA